MKHEIKIYSTIKTVRENIYFLAAALLCAMLIAFIPSAHADSADPPLSEGVALDDSYAGYAEDDIETDALEKWVESLKHLTRDFSATFMQQAAAVGGFFDAEEQIDAQRTIQGLTAQAHKDYHPSMQLCRFGTNIRSLHTTEHLQRTNTDLMNMAMLRRETLSANTVSSAGPDTETTSRLRQFKETYCDINDNNEGLGPMCETTSGPTDRVNRDIDYTRLLNNAYTLDVDLTNTSDTPDEQDLFALSKNLFTHKNYTDIPDTKLKLEHAKDDYQNMRSLQTIRGMARNSFSHIVGMKAKGTAGAAPYMYKMMEDFGMSEDDAKYFLGENPSYFAQMEVLTRQMYLQPSFYTNLYDKPANVERISASLQAIGLMQDRDRFEASLRREMLVSMILELSLRQKQEIVGTETVKSISQLFITAPK